MSSTMDNNELRYLMLLHIKQEDIKETDITKIGTSLKEDKPNCKKGQL